MINHLESLPTAKQRINLCVQTAELHLPHSGEDQQKMNYCAMPVGYSKCNIHWEKKEKVGYTDSLSAKNYIMHLDPKH